MGCEFRRWLDRVLPAKVVSRTAAAHRVYVRGNPSKILLVVAIAVARIAGESHEKFGMPRRANRRGRGELRRGRRIPAFDFGASFDRQASSSAFDPSPNIFVNRSDAEPTHHRRGQ